MTPAFTPNPTRNSAKSTCRIGLPAATAPAAARLVLPPRAERVRKAAMRHPVPTCDMARYRNAARRDSRCSCSIATSAAVDSVMTSHAPRNASASVAVTTSSTAPTSTLKATPIQALRARQRAVREVADAVDGDRYGDGRQRRAGTTRSAGRCRSPGRCRTARGSAPARGGASRWRAPRPRPRPTGTRRTPIRRTRSAGPTI